MIHLLESHFKQADEDHNVESDTGKNKDSQKDSNSKTDT